MYAKRLLKLVLNVCPIKQLYIIDNSANILKVVTKLINFKFMQLLLKFKMITRLQKDVLNCVDIVSIVETFT